jgi:hypothetical protein|tara:strand:- start:908 stop:1195 length:288 start_codon:yes stop_codon:yes gene_type:complete
MSDYKDRLVIAKKSYIATDGPGEASVRLLWTFKQLAHSYTNCDVENLRYLYPKLKKEAPFYGKDWAHIIGHVTQLFIIPTVVMCIVVNRKLKRNK